MTHQIEWLRNEEPSETYSGDKVRFEFMKFVHVDRQGKELEHGPEFGYMVYNNGRQDFGFGTFGDSDSYTIEYDVLRQIQNHHPAFMSDITHHGGFFIGSDWQEVTRDGELSEGEIH